MKRKFVYASIGVACALAQAGEVALGQAPVVQSPVVQSPSSPAPVVVEGDASTAPSSGTARPSPNTNSGRLTSRPTANRSGQRGNFRSISSTPYMVGDLPGQVGGTIKFDGVNSSPIAQVNVINNRLNLAENNSPVVGDRAYVTYRHFHNASEVNFFGGAPNGGTNTLNVDAWTFGLERKLTEQSSIEFRLPIIQQLGSDLTVSQTTGPVTTLPLNDTDVNVGNLGLIFKRALVQESDLFLSGGLSLNLPTGPDQRIRTRIEDAQYRVFDRDSGQFIGTPFPYRLTIDSLQSNDTVNLTPYLAAYWQPTESIYTLNFLQVDVPLNESRVSTRGSSAIGGQVPNDINIEGRIAQQVLLRYNLGYGKWLWKNDYTSTIHSLALLNEFHYTTTLNDSDTLVQDATNPNLGSNGLSYMSFGNASNRLDVLNTVVGLQAILFKTSISNGVAIPLRTQPDRGFDFEYSLLVNRRF